MLSIHGCNRGCIYTTVIRVCAKCMLIVFHFHKEKKKYFIKQLSNQVQGPSAIEKWAQLVQNKIIVQGVDETLTHKITGIYYVITLITRPNINKNIDLGTVRKNNNVGDHPNNLLTSIELHVKLKLSHIFYEHFFFLSWIIPFALKLFYVIKTYLFKVMILFLFSNYSSL